MDSAFRTLAFVFWGLVLLWKNLGQARLYSGYVMTRPFVKSAGPDWANILIGAWVTVSPFALGFAQNSGVRWDNIAVGVAVILLTFAAAKVPVVRGVIVLLGGWLLISPLVLGSSSTIVSWNNLVMGLLIIIGTILAESMRPIEISPVKPIK